MLENFLSAVFVLAVLIGLDILVKIYGWGLQPRSWAWIIGVGFFANLFVHMIASRLTKSDKQ